MPITANMQIVSLRSDKVSQCVGSFPNGSSLTTQHGDETNSSKQLLTTVGPSQNRDISEQCSLCQGPTSNILFVIHEYRFGGTGDGSHIKTMIQQLNLRKGGPPEKL